MGSFTTFTTLLVLFLALVLGGIKFSPEPKRTQREPGSFFPWSHVNNANKIRIVEANKNHVLLEEIQQSGCEADNIRGDCAPPMHTHTTQSETFEVLKGVARVYVDGEEHLIKAGETITALPGQVHTFVKSGPDDLTVRVKIFPNPSGLDQRFFATLPGTIYDSPNPIQIFYLFCEHGVRVPDIPGSVQNYLCSGLSFVAPLLGFKLEYSEYPYLK